MNKNSMMFRNEECGEYHVRILMPKEQCEELKLDYPLEVDVYVGEEMESELWEQRMREEIEYALFETLLPEDAEECEQEVCEALFGEIAWEWDLEEEKVLSEDRDPFSDKNREQTLTAYRLLHSLMLADGREQEVNRLFYDGNYAKMLFEEYHIPNSPYLL